MVNIFQGTHDAPECPFLVEGIELSDGSRTMLQEFPRESEAREWLSRYTRTESGWDRIEIVDTRTECGETVWFWERDEEI